MASEAAIKWVRGTGWTRAIAQSEVAFDAGVALGFAQGAASVQPPANGEKWVRASELEKLAETFNWAANIRSELPETMTQQAGWKQAVDSIRKLIASAGPLPSPVVDRAEIVAILATEYHNYFQSDAVSIEQAERTYGLLAEMCGWVK